MYQLEMKYKGDRRYLHGTDFYSIIEKKLGEQKCPGWLKRLAFKRFARNQCSLNAAVERESMERVIGYAIWQLDEKKTERFSIVEDNRPVRECYPFDEEKLIDSASISDKSITLDHKNEYTVIESIVALTKTLNYKLSPNIDGKWVFGQLELCRKLPRDCETIEVNRISEMANKFSCNKIGIDGQDIGEIRFIVGAP